MDTRMKELIAIGASVTANCIPCLKYHVVKGRQAGLQDAEIRAAIGVGRMVRKGAAGEWDKAAIALLGAEEPTGSEGQCGGASKDCGS